MSTSITGNIKDLSTAAVTNNCFLRFTLRGLNGNIPRVNGTALVANGPGQGLSYVYDFTPDASGAISGTLYSTRDAAGTGNGDIEAGGSLTAVWYGMTLWIGGVSGPEVAIHAKSGVTLDITNVTPLTTNPVSTSPSGDSTYLRLDGGNNPMTGQLAVKNGSVSSPGLTFASSLTTGFWRQAADVIGVSIAGALKWLINSVGPLFGSGEAVVWSSNSDPSAAVGDSFLSRIGAAILGIGSTNGGTNGELRLSKVNKVTITQPATGSTITIADGKTATINNSLTLAGTDGTTQTFQASDTIVGRSTTDTLTNKNVTGAGSGNAISLLNSQDTLSNLVGTGSDQTVYTFTIPANTVQAGKGIRLLMVCRNNNATAVTYKLVLGSTTIVTYTATSATNGNAHRITAEIFNNAGVQNAQIMTTWGLDGSSIFTNGSLTSAENMANSLVLKITASETAASSITPQKWFVELIQ